MSPHARLLSASRLRRATPALRPEIFRAALLATVASLATSALAQSGNIHPLSIEIDSVSNHFPSSVYAPAGNVILNAGATADWVLDSLANTDVDPNPNDSVAIGIVPNVTGAAGGAGHWRGTRIVDGIAGADQDIFLTGGKENDVSSWNVGPGSIGSSKYDVTQAYLASNQSSIYFGMERRGHNGTTAFDFEFNQMAPLSSYIPNRTVGDVLITFEMKGSGGSGSAEPFIFQWNGSAYVSVPIPPGVFTSINNTEVTPPPWGYVDSGGNWVLAPNIPRFEFAEAQVPLSILPGVNACGGSAFVQVRTRSSSTATSDLKDTTKIFQFVFGGPSAAGEISGLCGLTIQYDGSDSRNSSNGTTGLTYDWVFERFNGTTWVQDGTATGVSGDYTASQPGQYRAFLTVTEATNCSDTSEATPAVEIFPATEAPDFTITTDCDDTFAYSACGNGGTGSYNFTWTIEKEVSPGNWVLATTFTDGPAACSMGTLDVDTFAAGANGDGHYRAAVAVTDTQVCPSPATSPFEFDVAHALNPSISKTTANGATQTVTIDLAGADPSNATFQWQLSANGGAFANVPGATTSTLEYSSFETDATPTAIGPVTLLGDSYHGKQWTVKLRLKVFRTVNGVNCDATSNEVTVKKIEAVDP